MATNERIVVLLRLFRHRVIAKPVIQLVNINYLQLQVVILTTVLGVARYNGLAGGYQGYWTLIKLLTVVFPMLKNVSQFSVNYPVSFKVTRENVSQNGAINLVVKLTIEDKVAFLGSKL